MKSSILTPPGVAFNLPQLDGLPKVAHVFEPDDVEAIHAALATCRPLLVRGEPGTGKSQLARAAACALGRAFVATVIDAQTEPRDLLYTIDAVARLAEAQALGAYRQLGPHEVQARIAVERFLQPGPLWWAFAWNDAKAQERPGGGNRCHRSKPPGWTEAAGVVLLIDEIDKADSTVPNGLLEALGHGHFEKPTGGRVGFQADNPPLVVITTNEERALPDAFVRRCLVLQLGLPTDVDPGKADAKIADWLVQRGRAHFANTDEAVLREAARLLVKHRREVDAVGLCPPGQAEYLDLVRAVTTQRGPKDAQLELLGRVHRFALHKHPPERRR